MFRKVNHFSGNEPNFLSAFFNCKNKFGVRFEYLKKKYYICARIMHFY